VVFSRNRRTELLQGRADRLGIERIDCKLVRSLSEQNRGLMPKLIGIKDGDRILTFKEFLKLKKKVIVEAPIEVLKSHETWQRLDEATRAKVGRFQARRDQPHFHGDEYHAHAKIGGGYEVSWNVSGSRRHPNKFPAQIPKDARAAVAAVLGVDPSLLESFKVCDPTFGMVYLLEYKD
jgi:hypothetical protein